MNLLIIPRRAVAALLLAAVAASVPAQEPRRLNQPDSIPLDLATALLASGGLGGDPQILVGSFPGWMTGRVYVAPNARILGSAFIGTTAIAIISTPDMPDVAMTTMKRELATRGWKAPPAQPQFGIGGFRAASMMPSGSDGTRAALCGADQQYLTASATRRRGSSTDIIMRVSTLTGSYTPCNPQPLPPGYPRSSPWPTLYHPPGAMEGSQPCGADQSMGPSSMGGTVRTPMTNESLFEHYAKQLRDSGWKAAVPGGSIVGGTWTRPDSTGAIVELTLISATSSRDPSCRALSMSLQRPKGP